MANDARRILLLGSDGQVAWELRRTLATLGEVVAVGRNTEPLALDLERNQRRMGTGKAQQLAARQRLAHHPPMHAELTRCPLDRPDAELVLASNLFE